MFESKLPKNLKARKVRITFKEEIEPQEVFLDKLARKKAEELSLPEQKFEVLLSKRILQGFCFVFFALIFVLLFKTFQLQVIQGGSFSDLARQNYQRVYLVRPTRGVIYDSKGQQMVFNKPSFDLVCLKSNLPFEESEKEVVLRQVSEIIKKDLNELKEEINKSLSSPLLISSDFDHETLILLETKINKLPGFQIEKNTIREYIDGHSFSHLIGFIGRIEQAEQSYLKDYSITDYVGKTGVEKFYEKALRGKPGKFQVERDARGNQISSKKISSPEPGESLVLYLDVGLQKKIQEELQKSLKRVGAQKAAAVALDPRTGGVLALVSIPGFDNNLFSREVSQEELKELFEDPADPLFNRAMSGIGYPTGSTIKPFIATAALEEEIISPSKIIHCQGLISVENPYWPEIKPKVYTYHDWKIHGWTDLRKAIAESCNVYFYTIGGGYKDFKGLGPEKIKQYVELFGWGQKTGIDLPSEGEGILPEIDKNWRLGHTYHFSIGQGAFAVTPLQVAEAFSAIANKGILYEPRVVQKILKGSPDSPQAVEEIESRIRRQEFFKKENIEVVREGMKQAVTSPSGSSFILNTLPVSAAAKTGTAQTSKPGYNHAWVTVFAPYKDPQIVLTIVVESVKENQIAALPVAREVLDWYFSK